MKPQTTNTTKENCQYCHLHIDFLPDSDRSIFKWHLDGHGEKESLPQTTKEQVMEKWKEIIRGSVIPAPQRNEGHLIVDYSAMIKRDEDFISSTYDTAYKEGIKNEKEKLPEILKKYSDWLHKNNYIDSDYYTEEPKAVNRFLSELLKK